MLPYTAHTGMDRNDLRMFDRGAYKLAESQLEEDLSQLQPVLGYEYGTKDYIGMEARARGGPVEDGSDYLVGEEGPELMIPNEDGTIIPADVSAELMKYQQQGFDVTVDNGNITLFRENEDGSTETLKSDGTRTVEGGFGKYVFNEDNEVVSYTRPSGVEGLRITDTYIGEGNFNTGRAGERSTTFGFSGGEVTAFSDQETGAQTGQSVKASFAGLNLLQDREGGRISRSEDTDMDMEMERRFLEGNNMGSYLREMQDQDIFSKQSSQPVVVNAPQTSNSPVVNNTSVNNMSMPMSPKTHDESFTRTNNQNYNFG